MTEQNLHDKLVAIQTSLKAPKGQRNNFGNYNYRNCEDILEALKPLLKEHNCTVNLSDDIVMIGNRIYIKATVTLSDGKGELQSTAFAREADSKKGMDEAQITGSASSYARKYALNGLFAIDDTKDADHFDNRQNQGYQGGYNQGYNQNPHQPSYRDYKEMDNDWQWK